MKRWIVVVTMATVCAVLAIPASASFDHHFTARAKKVRIDYRPHSKFRVKALLVDPQNHHRRVGREWGRCKTRHHGFRCRQRFHFNGRIGGFGDIAASGYLHGHHRRENVVKGTHDFNGVAGKVWVGGVSPLIRFDLTR